MLHGPQGRRRAAAHHQGPAIEILLRDPVFLGKGVLPLRDQIDPAFKQVVDPDARDLPGLLLQREQQIRLVLQKAFDAVFVFELRNDLDLGGLLGKEPHGLRQKEQGLPDHHADGNAVPVFRAEILALFNSAFQILPHSGQKAHKLRPGRGQRRALAASHENREAHLVLQQLDLIRQGRLAHKLVLRGPGEIQRSRQLDAVVHLLRRHIALLRFNS